MKPRTETRTKYTDEPLDDLRVIPDSLPPPEQLVLKEDNVKVSITLSKMSVDFFKREARKHHTSYRKMIRRLADLYSLRHG
jgi:hypothetical protein